MARHASPRSDRRASRDALTPPTTPTSVLPSSSRSSKAPASRNLAFNSPAMPALLLCAPDRLQQPLPTLSSSPSRPLDFDSSPVLTTPPFVSDSSPRRTPEHPRVAEATPPAADPLFVPCTRPLLPSPTSSPPLRPTNRRKTLAGVAMTRTGGFSLRRIADQKKAKTKVAPIAGAAEALVCRGLGIISDGQVVTAAALEEFSGLFKDKVDAEVMHAIRKLFKVDTAADEAIDDALIGHGGAQGLDVEAETEAAAVSDV